MCTPVQDYHIERQKTIHGDTGLGWTWTVGTFLCLFGMCALILALTGNKD